MSKIDVVSNEWVDLVFQGRNQAYGAYQLRKGTSKRNLKSIFIMIVLAALLFAGIAVKNIVDENAKKVASTEVIELTNLNKPKKQAEVKQKKVEVEPRKL